MTMPPSLSVTTVPLHQRHHQLARQFAQAQPSPEKATQVYRNTLAVLALRDCLAWVDIPTDFAGSDTANPVLQLLEDVADLKLPGLGRLECRPIETGAAQYQQPSPIHEDCVGLVLVELSKPYQTADILGFTPQVVAEQIACADLQPLEDLFLHLDGLQTQAVTAAAPVSPRQRLSQWFANRGVDVVASTTSAWQTLSTLVDPQPQWVPGWYGMRSSPSVQSSHLQQLVAQLSTEQGISLPSDTSSLAATLTHLVQTSPDPETRWKAAELLWSIAPEQLGARRTLDLGLLFAHQPLSLMVAILPPAEHTQDFSVLVRVAPLLGRGNSLSPDLVHLPSGLSLAILKADGELGLQTQARARDNFIQIKLQAHLGETFSIQLRLAENVITEYFEV